jgi:hypothetical protein
MTAETKPDALAQCLAFSVEAMSTVINAASRLRYQPEETCQIYAIALHATIIEQFHSCIAMVEAEASTALPNTIRSMLEAVVELENLLTDPSYYQHMEASNLEQIVKLLSHSHLPILDGLREKHDVDRLRGQYEAQLGELTKAGFSPLAIWRRFKRADRMDQYNTLYALYCLDAHNNVAALAERHFGSAGDALMLFREVDQLATWNRMTTGLDYLISSSVMIHSAFRTGEQTVIDLQEQFKRDRLAGRFFPMSARAVG